MGLKNLIKRIAKEFEKKKIDYMIVGGQAVLIYGEPRLTRDIDITIGTTIEKLKDILEIAKNLKLKVLPRNPYNFVKETMVLPLLDEKTNLRVDLIFAYSDYEKEALKRVNKIKISNVYVNYISLEDLIIHKIISGRERDIEDLKTIISKNKKFDEKYVLKWLSEFEKILDKNLKEIFINLKIEAS
jgi:predicted nucleotidyltransferase